MAPSDSKHVRVKSKARTARRSSVRPHDHGATAPTSASGHPTVAATATQEPSRQPRGIALVGYEAWENAADEQSTVIKMWLPEPQRGKAEFVVEDDSPDGFRDLTEAYAVRGKLQESRSGEARCVQHRREADPRAV